MVEYLAPKVFGPFTLKGTGAAKEEHASGSVR